MTTNMKTTWTSTWASTHQQRFQRRGYMAMQTHKAQNEEEARSKRSVNQLERLRLGLLSLRLTLRPLPLHLLAIHQMVVSVEELATYSRL